MGFFDEMLAGGLAGAGKGMVDYATMQEREADKKAQLEAQMQLKREMLADQLASKRELMQMRMEGVGGSGGSGSTGTRSGGGGGSFIENMIRSAKTPEEQSQVIREVALRSPGAVAAVAEYFGRPLQEMGKTPDGVRLLEGAEGDGPTPPEYRMQNVSYDKQAGADALNRLIAMADPAKYDDYTKGETTAGKYDAAKRAAAGQDPETAAATIQSYTGNQDQRVIDSREAMNDAKLKAKGAGGGKGTTSANNIFKTVTDESGNVMGVKRDGTKVDLGIKSDSFNKQVASLVTKMNETEGGGFRKLPEDQKRARATERLLGSAQAPAAPTTDRMSQFKVIR